MRIVVCIKQVPGTTEVKLDPETHTIIRDGREAITNPFDTFALEEAVKLKESTGAEVITLSMGIPDTKKLLSDAVARGADGGALLSDRTFAGADTLATSYALSKGIQKIGPVDLILCGKMAVDGDTAQIGPELAEQLKIPHITDVYKIESVWNGVVTLWHNVEEGTEKLSAKLPLLLTIAKDCNQPRMPSIAGIRKSLTTEIKTFTAPEVGADPALCGLNGSPTQVLRTFTPEQRGSATELTGTAAQQAAGILSVIREVL